MNEALIYQLQNDETIHFHFNLKIAMSSIYNTQYMWLLCIRFTFYFLFKSSGQRQRDCVNFNFDLSLDKYAETKRIFSSYYNAHELYNQKFLSRMMLTANKALIKTFTIYQLQLFCSLIILMVNFHVETLKYI